MERERRHNRILDLISVKRIATQGELAAYLERAGFAVTQSSVSRDLEELGVIKRNGAYALPSTTNGHHSERGPFSIEAAGDALVVAKCAPGLASFVAVEIDRAMIPEIVGTLAGEDTVFVAVAEKKAQRVAIKKIWELFD